MDWVTLLLILIFFVFPLIQQLAEARKEKPPLEESFESPLEDIGTVEVPQRQQERAESAKPGADPTWSEGWGKWPGSEQEDTQAEWSRTAHPEREWERAKRAEPAWESERRARPEWERARSPRPAKVKIERIEIPPVQEIERRESVVSLPAATPTPRSSPPARAAVRDAPPLRLVDGASKRAVHPAVAALQSAKTPADLRSYIIMSEILDRPLSLRE